MSHKRIPKRKAAIAVGGVAALGAAAILLPNANASQDNSAGAATPKTLKATGASDLSSQLAGLLGDAFAGSYYDSATQQLVVNVISGDNNKVVVQAEKAGAKVREVQNSTAELTAAAQVLKTKATVPGTAWSVDKELGGKGVTPPGLVPATRYCLPGDIVECEVEKIGVLRNPIARAGEAASSVAAE